MKTLSLVAVLALATVGQLVATSARAQKADSLTRVKSEGSVAPAAADTRRTRKAECSAS